MDPNLVDAAVVPSVLGLCQVIKDAGLPSRFTPAVAVAIGVLYGMGQQIQAHALTLSGTINGVELGVGFGLASVGLYASTQTLARNRTLSPTPDPAPAPATK